MSLPLDIILEELESSPKSLIPILSTLYCDKTILNDISKPDLKHLVSRTLNLAKSHKAYNKWCGINLIRVLSTNYNILATEGVHFMNELLKILEAYNQTVDPKILSSTVECLNSLCDHIRGKPTLTRELLTPKLSNIISLYMEKITYQPFLIIKSLNSLVKRHPTTFRPYGNKLRNKLMEFLSSDSYKAFPQDLKQLICETLATLPIIEKTEPDIKWQQDIVDLVKELSQVLLVYDEFLMLNDDADLKSLFKKLPQHRDNDEQGQNFKFAPLQIDINKPNSIFQISDRVEVLLNILRAYLITETQFSVRVPIGMILIINEIICSISTKFISFRNDIRDDKTKKLIKSTLFLNYFNSVILLNELPKKYQGALIPHLNNILAFLEILIPFSNKKIDYQQVLSNELFMSKLLDCTGNFLSLVASMNDASLLVRFVDVALCLVEERNLNSSTSSEDKNQKQGVNGNKKKNKKKNKDSIPLSDLLSHQHLFSETIPQATLKSVRKFINIVITRVSLPPTQHYRVFRYMIIEAVASKSYNKDQDVPHELKQLLINSVLYPGFEKNSMLPIITSLLGDEPILSVFNNPRFPPLPTYVKKMGRLIDDTEEAEAIDEEEEEEEAEEGAESEKESKEEETEVKNNRAIDDEAELPLKRRKLEASGSVNEKSPEVSAPEVTSEKVDEEKLFTNAKPDHIIQQTEIEMEIPEVPIVATSSAPSPTPNAEITTTPSISVDNNELDGSDFEMPSIDVGDDSDDE